MRHRKQIQNIATTKFRTFCKHCTLHGFYYFSEKRHWMVYAIWTTIIISSLALCLFLSHMIWAKFVVDPTFTVVETTHYSTTQIPFPAVTVCDTEQVYGPHTDNITNILIFNCDPDFIFCYIMSDEKIESTSRKLHNERAKSNILRDLLYKLQDYRGFDQDQIKAFYESFTAVKKHNYNPSQYLKNMHKALNDLGYTYNVLLEMFSKPCDVLMVSCLWRSRIHNCTDMFRKVYTVAGYCCQFDMKFFRQHADPDTNFAAGVEVTEALSITVNGQKEQFTGEVSDGDVWLYVYDAKSSITAMDYPATLTPAGFFDINLHVWTINSSDDVKSLDMRTRKCRLKNELTEGHKFHQECIAIYVLRKVASYCRCVPFNYSASLLQVGDAPKCPWDRLMCVYQTLEKVKSDIKDIVYENDCLQRCDYVQYTPEIEYIQYERKIKKSNESYSHVVVHFDSTTCLKYKREVIYTWDQMLANLGGIFGLCFGGSVISLIEIIWFFIDSFITLLKARYARMAPKKVHVFTLTNKIKDGKYKFVN